jgi:hypothetical protein
MGSTKSRKIAQPKSKSKNQNKQQSSETIAT